VERKHQLLVMLLVGMVALAGAEVQALQMAPVEMEILLHLLQVKEITEAQVFTLAQITVLVVVVEQVQPVQTEQVAQVVAVAQV